MKRTAPSVFVLMLGIIATFVLCSGCEEEQVQPDVKQARLIAVENARLKSEIQTQKQRHEQQLAKQKEGYEKRLAKQKEQLDACLQQNRGLTELSKEGVEKYMEDVLASVVDENRKLDEEVKTLEAEIEKLKAQLE